MTMSNSPLVNYTRISPNRNSPRNRPIGKITVHHMAGNLTVEQCGSVFAPSSRQASSNYGIGTDGRVGLYVDEGDRSWASSSAANDNQAVTIEVANDEIGGNWHVSDAAWDKLVELCADICRRNGFRLNWTGDASGTLTCHYMFTATACPGPYLKGRMAELAQAVNARLDGSSAPSTGGGASGGSTSGGTPSGGSTGFQGGAYVCQVDGLRVRSAPGLSGAVVAQYNRGETVNLDSWYTIKDGYVWGRYTSYSGAVRYIAVGRATGKPEADDYLILKGTSAGGGASAGGSIVKGSKVIVTNPYDENGTHLAVSGTYDVIQVNGNRVVIGKGQAVTAAVPMQNLRLA